MKPIPFTILTGASSNHFVAVQNLLFTISQFEPAAKVIFYDLGLQQSESDWLSGDTPPFYLKDFQVRKFDFTKYPPHFNIAVNGGRMAFRPTILNEAATEFGGMLLWLDAGCLLRRPLVELKFELTKIGAHCPPTQGSIGDHLFSSARDMLATPTIQTKQMMDAATCGFNCNVPSVKNLLVQWARTALNPTLTAPEGSVKRTHRQDAVFSALLYALNLPLKTKRHIQIRCDNFNPDNIRRFYRRFF